MNMNERKRKRNAISKRNDIPIGGIENCVAMGNGGAGFYVRGVPVDMRNNSAFLNRGAGFDIAAENVPPHPPGPPELWEQTLALLREQGIAGKKPTPEDAEHAAARTGLKQWLADNGVNLANLGVTILAYVHTLKF
jgi:hypothetical protein